MRVCFSEKQQKQQQQQNVLVENWHTVFSCPVEMGCLASERAIFLI